MYLYNNQTVPRNHEQNISSTEFIIREVRRCSFRDSRAEMRHRTVRLALCSCMCSGKCDMTVDLEWTYAGPALQPAKETEEESGATRRREQLGTVGYQSWNNFNRNQLLRLAPTGSSPVSIVTVTQSYQLLYNCTNMVDFEGSGSIVLHFFGTVSIEWQSFPCWWYNLKFSYNSILRSII